MVRPFTSAPTVEVTAGTAPLKAPSRMAARRAAAGSRYFTGFDGVRRPVTQPTPREVLQRLAPAPVFSTETLEINDELLVLAPEAARKAWGWQRPAIAFGLVATAMVAAGTMSLGLNANRTVTARAEASAVAAIPAATPDPAVLAAAQQQAQLQQLLDAFAAGQSDKFGIVVKDLKTGATATINPNRQLISASLYKMFVAQQIYRMADTGQISYGDPAGGGTGRNIEDCLRIMINVSDNGCGRALGKILGWGSQNEALKTAGYTNTNLASPQKTSAQDVATMLERLYKGTLNSPNSNQRYMDLLKGQRVNNRLPMGLPQGTLIAHKTGDLDGYVHDAGIVYGPKTEYLVVVTSGQWARPGEAPAKFADLSARLWGFFQK